MSQNQSLNRKKRSHDLFLRSIILKLQEKVLKFNDIYVSWCSPKTEPETNFLNLEKPSFENVSFILDRNYLRKSFCITY